MEKFIVMLVTLAITLVVIAVYHLMKKVRKSPTQQKLKNEIVDFRVKFYASNGWYGTFWHDGIWKNGVLVGVNQQALKSGDVVKVVVGELSNTSGLWVLRNQIV